MPYGDIGWERISLLIRGLSLLLTCHCFQVFGKNDVWFWVIFSLIHVLASLALSTQIYYMGRFKIGKCCDRTALLEGVQLPPALSCVCQPCGVSGVQSCGLSLCSGLSCPLTPLMLFLAPKVLVLLLPRPVGVSRTRLL